MSSKKSESDVQAPRKVTDIDAARWNVEHAVAMFTERWISLPEYCYPCEVMDQGALRDVMGLRATIDLGDPWPAAEQILLQMGFRWHWLGNMRVMYLRERDEMINSGFTEAEEVPEPDTYGHDDEKGKMICERRDGDEGEELTTEK